ncbi:MAG: response regulator transcription factor [Clostridiales Family XIII bacterium]|jgi:DNA-binding response OmpR family regulator|nr:response regulator transcription factor [Clostridiales Family XIII bacterium]
MEAKILYAEDDDIIASGVVYALEAEGYEVAHKKTVREANAAVSGGGFDLAILDLALPDGSGFDIIGHIRERGDMPVIFVTAADDEGNTVKGLELGADDYIAKPLRVRELIARVKAVLRRRGGAAETSDSLSLGGIAIRPSEARVFRGDAELLLSALEYRLLLIFATNKNQTLTRDQILEHLWDEAGNFVNDNTLTVYIKRLREKIEDDPQEPKLITTVRGMGYRAEG